MGMSGPSLISKWHCAIVLKIYFSIIFQSITDEKHRAAVGFS